MINLISNDTCWVLFLSTSLDMPEDRHIHDISHGVHCLEQAGISPNNIQIYIDGIDRRYIHQKASISTKIQYKIEKSDELFKNLQTNTYKNIVLFVTGHGGAEGLDSLTPISPNLLIQSIKGAPNFEIGIIYLGQCYAGIFNYTNVSQKTPKKDIVVVGATNLHSSLSLDTNEKIGTIPHNWTANIFLLYTFKWFLKPVDVDGDGVPTIMDSYKYAGTKTNIQNQSTKANNFINLINAYNEIAALQDAQRKDPNNLNLRLDIDAKLNKYQSNLNNHFIHQESWILNAIPAQQITI